MGTRNKVGRAFAGCYSIFLHARALVGLETLAPRKKTSGPGQKDTAPVSTTDWLRKSLGVS